MNKKELDNILEKHKKWLSDNNTGKRADLIYANLSNANLSNVNFKYANLTDADLKHANLSNVNLSDADLSGADLRNADLSKDTKFNLNQLTYLNSCYYYENNEWIAFKDSELYKGLLG